MRLIVCGAAGAMGRSVAACARETGDEVVCGVDVAPMSAIYPVYPRFSDIREEADVMIDLSSPNGLSDRLAYALAHKTPIAIGTTGFTAEDEETIRACAKSLPIFKSGNFSAAVFVMQELVRHAAAVLENFDAEIVERHHDLKKDAPSGTALMLAENIREVRGTENVCGRCGACGPRKSSEVGIHAVRGGNLVGEHEVMFAGTDEVLTIAHSARSKRIFAMGALRAARWIVSQKNGLYGMRDMLGGMPV